MWAARNDKKRVDREDFDYARDKILMGAKREEVLQEKEKEKTAYGGPEPTASFFYYTANRTRENLRLRIDKTPINGHEIKSVKKQAPCPH